MSRDGTHDWWADRVQFAKKPSIIEELPGYPKEFLRVPPDKTVQFFLLGDWLHYDAKLEGQAKLYPRHAVTVFDGTQLATFNCGRQLYDLINPLTRDHWVRVWRQGHGIQTRYQVNMTREVSDEDRATYESVLRSLTPDDFIPADAWKNPMEFKQS
jgi:hypothetical protein